MKFLNIITITGADDNTNIKDLIDIYEKYYNFVEFGILFSRKQNGNIRFPSFEWINELVHKMPSNAKLSVHFCGSIVRDTLLGKFLNIVKTYPFLNRFQRIQLNTHAEKHDYNIYFQKFMTEIENLNKKVIFQYDNVNTSLIEDVMTYSTKDSVNILYDLSHGTGVLPENWISSPFKNSAWGYAGGLGVDNLNSELNRIYDVNCDSDNPFVWIDAETKLRTIDEKFDINIANDFLRKGNLYIK